MKKTAPKLLDTAGATMHCKWRYMQKIPIYCTAGLWWWSGLQLCIASLFIIAHFLEMAWSVSLKHRFICSALKQLSLCLDEKKSTLLNIEYFHSLFLANLPELIDYHHSGGNCLNYRTPWSCILLNWMTSSKYLLRSNQSLFFKTLSWACLSHCMLWTESALEQVLCM